MKILCAVFLLFICYPDVITAHRRHRYTKRKDPFCFTREPEPPTSNVLERISVSMCNQYTWEASVRDYKEKWAEKCEEDNVGILRGTKTTKAEFPHMGGLGWWSENEWKFLCGGSLISPNFVLTAAHCSSSYRIGQPKIVRFGTTNIDIPTGDYKDADIEKIIKHPNYASPITYFDIALIQLTENLSFSKFIQPACLWTSNNLGYHKYGANVTGWGLTKARGGDKSSDLLVANLDVLDERVCKNLLRNNINRNWKYGLSDHQLCAANLKQVGTDTCQGDSGGPIQFMTQSSTTRLNIYYVFGITSTGRSCGLLRKPGLYTKVASFTDWIEETVWPQKIDSKFGNSNEFFWS